MSYKLKDEYQDKTLELLQNQQFTLKPQCLQLALNKVRSMAQ